MLAALSLAAMLHSSPQAAGAIRHNEQGGFDMVFVPAGEFQAGDATLSGNLPHTTRTGAFWIGQTPVTVAQFRAYCGAANYSFPWTENEPSWGWQGDHPMVMVTWQEAQAFCKWAGGTLPSEDQWEKAARGTEGHDFPWGDTWEPRNLWWSADGKIGGARKTVPVMRKDHISASPYGCTDMAGNVLQWCSDWMTTPSRDPEASPRRGKTRVLRGGSWDMFLPAFFRSAYRYDALPALRSPSDGFRFAMPAR